VSRTDTLKKLEHMLESFLDRAVALKAERIGVLDGINRLDDIAREMQGGNDVTDSVGSWFATHNRWLDDRMLRPAERRRVNGILDEIRRGIPAGASSSPATRKVAGEIDRWTGAGRPSRPDSETASRLVLRRGTEEKTDHREPTIAKFANTLEKITNLFADCSGNKKHLMSALDDALLSAGNQGNKEALHLSALIIYYLKQNGYKVEPYVSQLKEAERLQKGHGGSC